MGAYLKLIIAMFYFCHSKNSSNIMKESFNSISVYSLKKFLLANIRNKCVIRKIICLQKLIKFRLLEQYSF